MWIPKDEDELLAALERGDLQETPSFDCKRELPGAGKNSDIAKDVAAMSLEGGVLIYGIGEGKTGRLTDAAPFPIQGLRERVDQVCQTAIAEPPRIAIHEIRTAADPDRGYLVVEVPASPRAPHMVTLSGDNHYYGRGATGNRKLSEGEVARYYERRQRWEIDRDAYLDAHLTRSHTRRATDARLAYMYAVARPVASAPRMLERPDERVLLDAMATAATGALQSVWAPDVGQGATWSREGADAWSLNTRASSIDGMKYLAEIVVQMSGEGAFFSGRAGISKGDDQLLVYETAIRGNLERFIAAMGELYRLVAYNGPVDLGVAVTGLRGSVSQEASTHYPHGAPSYDAEDYRRTERVLADQLVDERATVVEGLLARLFAALNPRMV